MVCFYFYIFVFTVSSLFSSAATEQKPADYFVILADNGKIIVADPATYKRMKDNNAAAAYEEVSSKSGSILPVKISLQNALSQIDQKSLLRLTFMDKVTPVLQITINKVTKEYLVLTSPQFSPASFNQKQMNVVSKYAPAASAQIAKMLASQKAKGSLEAPVEKPVIGTPVVSPATTANVGPADALGALKVAAKETAKTVVANVVKEDPFLSKFVSTTKEAYLILKKGAVFFSSDLAAAVGDKSPDQSMAVQLTQMITPKQRAFIKANVDRVKKALGIMQLESTIDFYQEGKKIAQAIVNPDDSLQKIVCKNDDSKKVITGEFGTALKQLFKLSSKDALENLITKKDD